MRMVLYLALFLVAFAGAVVGTLAATGNLNKEGLDKILGKGPKPVPAPPAEEADDLDPLLRAVKEREKKLDERDAELREREARVKTAEEDLQKLRDEFSGMMQEYAATLDKADTEKEQRRQEIAALFEKMKPDQVADILATKEPEEAVTLLLLIPEKNRAKVLDKLEPDRAAAIIDAMQQPEPVVAP